jgi:hypothetical protein
MPPQEFWYGVLGGFFAELFGMWKLRHGLKAELPPYLRSWFYWLMTILMVATGGLLSFVYLKSGVTLSPLLAVNVGATAPLMIGSLTATQPKIN